jgi:hypothetical protein
MSAYEYIDPIRRIDRLTVTIERAGAGDKNFLVICRKPNL